MKKILLIVLCLSLLAFTNSFAQNRNITGRVIGADDGQPIPGATVKVQGSTQATQTNANGNYSITVPGSTSTLLFSFVGYSTQPQVVGGRTVINVSLVGDIRQMNEVVITGYTTSSRDKSTGSTGKVTANQISDVPQPSFEQTLQGRVPGLSILAGSGQPGSVASVYIRGATTISGSNTPLYIIDGVPVESSVFSTLNPNDFESVDVLKDASATSLYGSRGANGVLVITTKRGKAGKTVFTYDVQGGFSQRSSEVRHADQPTTIRLTKNA